MSNSNNVLHLTLKKKWFDMISSGYKKEEYREIKNYWIARLINSRKYDYVKFVNGYGAHRPSMLVELLGICASGTGKQEWGAEPGAYYIVLSLGRVMVKNGVSQIKK